MSNRAGKVLRRLLALALGLAILGLLLHHVGWRDLAGVMRSASPTHLVIAFAFFIPQVAVMAWRWQIIGSVAARFSFRESLRMVMAGSALNVILPSKLGDLCKGLLVAADGGVDVACGLGLAGLDKLLDVLGLAAVLALAGAVAPRPEPWVTAFWAGTVVGLAGLLYLLHRARPVERIPRRGAFAALARALNAAIAVRQRRAGWLGALGLSLLLWMLHVGQISVFYAAVGTSAPAAAVWSRVPMGIFIGLLPVTVAGIGTRDAAFYVLMAPWDPRPVIAWLGLFCTLRYVVMALLGVPAIVSLGSTVRVALSSREKPAPERSNGRLRREAEHGN